MDLPFLVIMGVSGCGKTTLASQLAERIDGTYLEGDDYHPPGNKEKMGAGTPLTDEDRWPWYRALNEIARDTLAKGSIPVMSCSALKRAYRDVLFDGIAETRLVFLDGSFELIKGRMDSRDHEYMTSTLLESQFATLEAPEPEEGALCLSIVESPADLLEQVVAWLGEPGLAGPGHLEDSRNTPKT
jgi:carbohydrate kinase (thermoresistant glucokinase family)